MVSFDEWVRLIFGNPETGWWLSDGVDPAIWGFPNEHPGGAVQYLTMLFSQPECLRDYLASQVADGLSFLVNSIEGDHIRALHVRDVPCHLRVQCIKSMATLFERYLAEQCGDYVGHLADMGLIAANPLGNVCYMWWDVIPLWPQPDVPCQARFPEAILHVMKHSLRTDSIACQESALHGLNHYMSFFRQEARQEIDAYLARIPKGHVLAEYAVQCKGRVA